MQLKSLGIIDSGKQLEVGIGAIEMARVRAFYNLAVEAGILETGSVDVAKVATAQFVNKKGGMDLT